MAARDETLAFSSGRKRAKYVVCEMARKALEVNMEVPVSGMEYLVSAASAPEFLSVSARAGSPRRVTEVL